MTKTSQSLKTALSREMYTVRDMGWQSKKNGELLALMLTDGFEALITFDKNLRHQQNFEKYPLAVLVLNAWGNLMPLLEPLLPELRDVLSKPLLPGVTIIR